MSSQRRPDAASEWRWCWVRQERSRIEWKWKMGIERLTFHSAMRRLHSPMTSEGTSVLPGMGLVGRVEKRWTKFKGSCRSCSARVKVGYLESQPGSKKQQNNVSHAPARSARSTIHAHSPLFDKMVQPRNRLGVLEILRQTPFLPSDCSRKLLGETLVFSELDKQRLVEEVLDVLVVVKRGGGRRPFVGSFLVERLARVDTWYQSSPKAYSRRVRQWFPDLPLRIQRRRKSESEI